jgi:hypothetical protein
VRGQARRLPVEDQPVHGCEQPQCEPGRAWVVLVTTQDLRHWAVGPDVVDAAPQEGGVQRRSQRLASLCLVGEGA